MSNVKSREETTLTVRGREFRVERIEWKDSDGLSFDVYDDDTSLCLTEESFDDEPVASDIEEILDELAEALRDGSLGEFYRDEPRLAEVVGVEATP